MSGVCLVNQRVAFVAVLLLFAAGCVTGGDEVSRQNRKADDIRQVGGCCSYTSYDGAAQITRIVKTDASRKQVDILGGPGYEGYEIWFRFFPDGDVHVEGWQADLLHREHILTLHNSWYPGPRFLEKYGLSDGGEYPCTLKIIKTGTCTPMVFEFQTIDITDYSEIQ